MAQGVSEPPGPVGDSSSVPGSTRRSSSDWTNDEGNVDPRASSRSVTTTVDQIATRVAKQENGPKITTRRYLKFNEDIAEIIGEVGVPTPTTKGATPPGEKEIRIVKEETLKGDKIVKYTRKTSEEERVFRPTRSLARSPLKGAKDEVTSASELDTPAEMSDSGSKVTVTRKCLKRKAMMNRATAEVKDDDDDNIVTCEIQATMIIKFRAPYRV